MSKVTAIRSFFVKPETLTASQTLDWNDSNRTLFLNAVAGFTVTLPKPKAGVKFEFIVKTAPTSGDYVIGANAGSSIVIGQIFTSDINQTTRPDFVTAGVENIKLKRNAAKVGDSVELVSDGTSWYVKGFVASYDGILLVEESKSPSVSPSVSPS